MAINLYDKSNHRVLLFSDLVKGEGIQSNQLVVIDNGQSALFDPGGELTFTALNMAMAYHQPISNLTYLFASHQDPDILSSLSSWFRYTSAKVVIPSVWCRFLEHLVPHFMSHYGSKRFISVADGGTRIPLGHGEIIVLPAHFLHSIGNVSFYDPISKILFSGDIGASIVSGDAGQAVQDFDRHIGKMLGFHQRYMVSNKVCRFWVNMIRQLEINLLIPQHGQYFVGKPMIEKFLAWLENLDCGIDRMTQYHYRIPDSLGLTATAT